MKNTECTRVQIPERQVTRSKDNYNWQFRVGRQIYLHSKRVDQENGRSGRLVKGKWRVAAILAVALVAINR